MYLFGNSELHYFLDFVNSFCFDSFCLLRACGFWWLLAFAGFCWLLVVSVDFWWLSVGFWWLVLAFGLC